jgi:hypothetical protein
MLRGGHFGKSWINGNKISRQKEERTMREIAKESCHSVVSLKAVLRHDGRADFQRRW